MIAALRGIVTDIQPLAIVLEVHGVGYRVAVSRSTDYTLGTDTYLHTHLAVRENALDLYGFETRDELVMFEHLLKLPKIGPKSAMQIMNQADLALLQRSIATEDPSYLSKMSGIGKKSAEKIVAGLKGVFGESGTPDTGHAGMSDAIDALIALGYSERNAREALQKVPEGTIEIDAKIREALKIID